MISQAGNNYEKGEKFSLILDHFEYLKILWPFLSNSCSYISPMFVCLQSAHYGLRKLILCCKKSFFVSAPLCLQSVSTTVSSSSQPSDVYISPLTHVYFDIEAIHCITDTVQWCVYFYIISSTLSPLGCGRRCLSGSGTIWSPRLPASEISVTSEETYWPRWPESRSDVASSGETRDHWGQSCWENENRPEFEEDR